MQADRIVVSWPQLVVALLLCVLPPLLTQVLEVGPDGVFSAYGLQGIWLPLVPCIFVAVVWSRHAHGCANEHLVLALVVRLLYACVAIDAFATVLASILARYDASHADYVSWYFPWIWLGVATAVLLLRERPLFHLQGPRLRTRALAVLAGGVLAALLIEVMPARDLWNRPYPDAAPETAMLAEDVLYLQPTLLDDALDRLARGPADSPNLYFLGVAGDAGQGVFRRELQSVQQLFLERFTTPDRSLLLINSRQTLRTDPIASVSALEVALDRIGAVMDRERDILFLYLTSHGSPEHGVALEFAPLALAELGPEMLRTLLDNAGIRWRVIVVSACYSGIFVAPLADEHTLVITAAAADRTSFGCSDENDYTYFGRAFFVDGLGGTDSFIDAFDVAQRRVTELERAESETPSEPQIAIGERIRAQLDAYLAARAAQAVR